MDFNVCVAGATGNVGRTMIQILEERKFPCNRIRFLASHRSVGKKLPFRGAEITVEELTPDSFEKGELVLSSPGGAVSKWYVPSAVKAGALIIDNTSAFRMVEDVPLVVPEVNPEDSFKHKGIIANPNCSTIQMVVVLKPLHDAAEIERVVVSTYQSVSGAGIAAINELREQSREIIEGKPATVAVFPYGIAFNCIPQIPQKNAFEPNFYSEEEMKMVNETQKIMHAPSIRITATTVRVPVFIGHGEAVNIETRRKLTRGETIAILSKAPGVTVVDDPSTQRYPLQTESAGKDDTFVGRIREDISHERGLSMWIVSDNLRKGAALNAIQIAELFL